MSNHLNFKVNKSSDHHQGFFMPQNREKYKGVKLPFFRSGWERSMMEFLDRNPNVIEWISEKPEVPYINPLTGTKWHYHPDFVVKIKEGSTTRIEMIEIKPKHETEPPVPSPKKRKKTLMEQQERWVLNDAKWKAARAYCKAHNWNFKVLYMENKVFKEATTVGLRLV